MYLRIRKQTKVHSFVESLKNSLMDIWFVNDYNTTPISLTMISAATI